jgi:hypothetical protein
LVARPFELVVGSARRGVLLALLHSAFGLLGLSPFFRRRSFVGLVRFRRAFGRLLLLRALAHFSCGRRLIHFVAGLRLLGLRRAIVVLGLLCRSQAGSGQKCKRGDAGQHGVAVIPHLVVSSMLQDVRWCRCKGGAVGEREVEQKVSVPCDNLSSDGIGLRRDTSANAETVTNHSRWSALAPSVAVKSKRGL